MQDIAGKQEKLGDDKSINFRPSPNFKHMKKYLKSKFEEGGCTGATGFPAHIEQELAKEAGNKANATVAVQPPLPPGTPPPDYPPNFVLKKEVIDDGYENNNSQQQNENGSNTQDKTKPAQTEPTDKPKKIMCKDFVRGTCKRVPCNYNHELDLTQLKGVYKFCRDFANGKCKRPVCFFVHATTFEKEYFFRTGSLPPHTLSHLKDPAIAQQPQPVSEVPAQPCVPVYPANPVNPATPSHPDMNSCAPSLPPILNVPPAAAPVAAGTFNMYNSQPPQPALASPPKRNRIEGAGLAREEDAVQNNCINCKLAEIRYQQSKMKLEEIEKSTNKIKENIALLDQKKAKLMAVLTMLLWKDMPR